MSWTSIEASRTRVASTRSLLRIRWLRLHGRRRHHRIVVGTGTGADWFGRIAYPR